MFVNNPIYMVNAILISKSGELASVQVNKVSDLYKKCKFRSRDGFTQQAEWSLSMSGKTYSIRLYAKIEGKTMNKYVFPPPVDCAFYGDCILVNMMDDQLEDLSIAVWTYHEGAFVGEDACEEALVEEADEENELEEEPYDYPIKLTAK